MKAAHSDEFPATDASLRELLEQARDLEEEGELEQAIGLYDTVLKKDRKNEAAYNRLFIIYRKLKDYRSELQRIDGAIVAFEPYTKALKKPKAGIEKLSMSLGKLTGLIDKKGNSLYDPEPVATWKRRRLMVLKRLKAKPVVKKKSSASNSSVKITAKAPSLRVASRSAVAPGGKSTTQLKAITNKKLKKRKK